MSKAVDNKIDFPKMEHRILGYWEDTDAFRKLVEKNRGKEKWSFIDGPITANNPMGVHHGWGRTFKDMFQRYHAMKGYDLRYQNGFDCQGLWVEVEVEKELGFNSKREIEAYGLDRFAQCVPGARTEVRRHHNAAVETPGPVDGLGKLVLHDVRHQQRVHLVLPEQVPGERLALSGRPLDALVLALWHVPLPARDSGHRQLPRGDALARSSASSRSPRPDTKARICWYGPPRPGR